MIPFPPSGKLLMIRMGAMGDIVHALPSAATLRRAFPNAEIDWLVEEHWAMLLEGNPHVTQVRTVKRRDWSSLMRTVSELRERRYDCVIDFQGLMKSAAIAYFSGATRTVGFSADALKERPAGLAYRHRVDVPAAAHVVEQNLALVHAVANGALAKVEDAFEFPLPGSTGEATKAARPFPGDYLAVSPSAGWAAKRWPVEKFAELAARVDRELGWPTVINCGPGEESLARAISREGRTHVSQGGLRELIAMARGARAFVAGDTGPLHIAAALGTPVVAVFGPTSPRRNGPYAKRARIVRPEGVETTYSRSATADDIARVTVDEVFNALVDVSR